MMKRIVITGATSMVALACIDACLNADIQVVALVRPHSSRLFRLPKDPRLTVIPCDITQLDKVELPKEPYDVFYHCAWGATSHQGRFDAYEQASNILYALDAVRLASRYKCKRFVGVGSQAEYGITSTQMGPNSPTAPLTPYGIAKNTAYKLCQQECRSLGMDFLWARIFSIYGPYDNEHTLINDLLNAFEANQRIALTPCTQIWDYLYSADCGKAMMLIGLRGCSGATYCVGSGIGRPLYEYVYEISALYGVDVKDCIGKLKFPSQQSTHIQADIRTLTKDTGFVPEIGFTEGIRRIIAYKRSIE